MPIGDQLDSVIKTFSHLQKQGIDIGDDGRELIEHSEWVKAKFAKKWTIGNSALLLYYYSNWLKPSQLAGAFSFMLPEQFIPDIEALGKRFNEPALLAQVTQAIQDGQAMPVAYDNTLIIMKPIKDHQDRIGMFVWIGIHRTQKGVGRYFQLVHSMAKASKMNFIRFETKRKGFVKLGARFGYERIGQRNDYTIYQKEVN